MLSGIAFLQINKVAHFIYNSVALPVELKMHKAGASDDLTEGSSAKPAIGCFA